MGVPDLRLSGHRLACRHRNAPAHRTRKEPANAAAWRLCPAGNHQPAL